MKETYKNIDDLEKDFSKGGCSECDFVAIWRDAIFGHIKSCHIRLNYPVEYRAVIDGYEKHLVSRENLEPCIAFVLV